MINKLHICSPFLRITVPERKINQLIWDEFRKGSNEALEIIYQDNYPLLYHYGMKFYKDADLVKDLIQELFMELIDSGTKLSRTDNILFYLIRAFRNKVTRHLSEQSRFSSISDGFKEFSLTESIETQLIKSETDQLSREQVTDAIKKLSPKQQEIIYLRFYCDLSYEEISTLFDVNVQTGRNLMSRAISTLKQELIQKRLRENLILFFYRIALH